MKTILCGIVSIFLSLNLFATVSQNTIIRGVVKAFDKKTITLQVGDKKVNIERTKFDKELVPRAGMLLDVELTENEFAGLNPL